MNLFFLTYNSIIPVEDTYKTIAGKAEGLYREKGSRFLAIGFPVTSEIEIKKILTSLRKEYHDARHHCYAYRIGTDNYRYRTNDDGEPSGTAGKPIYGQIVSHELTQVLISVVRYFGGTLLGTGGLINAYRSAVVDMLSRAQIVEKAIEVVLRLDFAYPSLNDVMKIIKEESVIITGSSFDNDCKVTVNIRKSKVDQVKKRLALVDEMKCEQTGSDLTLHPRENSSRDNLIP
jgi:uncharacterized YigZ family protein